MPGDFELNGKGVEKSDEEAVKWYRKATAQKSAMAQETSDSTCEEDGKL